MAGGAKVTGALVSRCRELVGYRRLSLTHPGVVESLQAGLQIPRVVHASGSGHSQQQPALVAQRWGHGDESSFACFLVSDLSQDRGQSITEAAQRVEQEGEIALRRERVGSIVPGY